MQAGGKRLAIERESFTAESIDSVKFYEEAFGQGRVYTWDTGDVEITVLSPKHMVLVFTGGKISGKYEMRKMRWYPGNRWLLQKT